MPAGRRAALTLLAVTAAAFPILLAGSEQAAAGVRASGATRPTLTPASVSMLVRYSLSTRDSRPHREFRTHGNAPPLLHLPSWHAGVSSQRGTVPHILVVD